MALSREEKEALADHYKNQDIYDPSKVPEQEVPTFRPQAMNCGGMAEKQDYSQADGYAFGGGPGIDLSQPGFSPSDFSINTGDSDTAKSTPIPPPETSTAPFWSNFVGNPEAWGVQPSKPAVVPPQKATMAIPAVQPTLRGPAGGSGLPKAPVLQSEAALAHKNEPTTIQAAPDKLGPDEYTALIQGLKPSLGQRLGQGAFSGLAGLADAIETGVARAPNPGFQKNIEETRQNQKTNLANALRAKYEAGFKGTELAQGAGRLAEEGRHNLESEKETREARRLTKQAQDLALAQHTAQIGLEKGKLEAEENKTALEQAEKTGGIWNKIKGTVGLGVPGPDPAILARAQGKGAEHPQDAQAIAWARANPRDPRSAKILKANGQ